jgi:hypothetical protein
MDDEVVFEARVEFLKSDISLLSFPTRSDGVVSGVAGRVGADGKQVLSLKLEDSPVPFVASSVSAVTFVAGMLSDGSLRLIPFSSSAIVAPNASALEDVWTQLPHRLVPTAELLRGASEKVVSSAVAVDLHRGVNLKQRVEELFARSAIAAWTDVCNLCNDGLSCQELLDATQSVARVVRGVWVRKRWGKGQNAADERIWRELLLAFVLLEAVERKTFLTSLPVHANRQTAKSMLEAIAVCVGSSADTRRWMLKAAPDLKLMAEFPSLLDGEDDDDDGLEEVVAEPPVLPQDKAPAPKFGRILSKTDLVSQVVLELFDKHGVVADGALREWMAKSNVSEELVASLCEMQEGRSVWTLRRDVLNRKEALLGDYVFAALTRLCRAPVGTLMAKKAFTEAFSAEGLPEASDMMYKRAVRIVAVSEKSKWRMKTGEI